MTSIGYDLRTCRWTSRGLPNCAIGTLLEGFRIYLDPEFDLEAWIWNIYWYGSYKRIKRTGGCIFARVCNIYIPRPCKLYKYKTVYHLVFERLHWCQDGETLEMYFIMPWSRVYHYQLQCSYFSISPLTILSGGPSGTWYEKIHSARSSSMDRERVRKQVRNYHSSHGGFYSLHVQVIHDKIKQIITTQIQENSTKFVVKRDLRSTRQSCGHRFWTLFSTISNPVGGPEPWPLQKKFTRS